ncbi:MAG: hypothetical protein DRH56_07865 [Deltaproteobacteria bacterium]|nr:MAG: hypothetical protein DRH56_07865 [Deltaproteobacteria bacterium]
MTMERCVEKEETLKPPLGVMPETLYRENRIRDLAMGIHRYVLNGFFGGEHAVTVGIWCDELSRRLRGHDRDRLYNELLMAVETKHPGESRHQTALRYIRNAESRRTHVACKGDGGT